MNSFKDLPVKEFSLTGVISDDSVLWQRKKDYLELLGIQMRSSGYVIRLDIATRFQIEYNSRNSSYRFYLAVSGVYVGERESEWIFGVDEEGPIPLPIPQSRSSEYYSEVG